MPDADDGPVTVWSNWNVRETMPDPWLPLTWDFWRIGLMPRLVHQVAGVPPSSRINSELLSLDLLDLQHVWVVAYEVGYVV